jgi:hypothetical protein
MDASQALVYVTAAAAALDLPLDQEAARSVAEHLARTAALARLLGDVDLGPEVELAEIYRPAPFPMAMDTKGTE